MYPAGGRIWTRVRWIVGAVHPDLSLHSFRDDEVSRAILVQKTSRGVQRKEVRWWVGLVVILERMEVPVTRTGPHHDSRWELIEILVFTAGRVAGDVSNAVVIEIADDYFLRSGPVFFVEYIEV